MNHSLQTYHLISERRKTLLVLLLNAALALFLIFALLLPSKRRTERLHSNIDEIADTITRLKGRRSAPAGALLQRTKKRVEALEHRWEIVRSRADTFKKDSFVDNMVPGASDNRIDFRVALYKAREKLIATAIEADTELPRPLALKESVPEGSDPALKMWQIASIIKILSTIMEHGAKSIDHIEVLEPQEHPSESDFSASAYEFPVAVSFKMDFESLTQLIDHSLSGENFLAWRAINIEKQSRHPGSPLHVDAIIAAEHLGMDPGHPFVVPNPKVNEAN